MSPSSPRFFVIARVVGREDSFARVSIDALCAVLTLANLLLLVEGSPQPSLRSIGDGTLGYVVLLGPGR